MMYTFNLQGLLTSWFLCGAILMAVINSAYAIEQYPANPSVKIFTVAKRDIPEWSEYHGVVGSRNYVDVIGQVMGRIKAVHVQVGQVVKKGELLIELDGPGGVILVNSPQDGTVINKRVNPGDFAMPGLPANLGYPAGRILLSIYDPNALWFEASIPERFSRQVKVGSKAGVTIASAGLSIESRFVEVQPGVDENTRTFVARIDLPPQSDLKLGMFGRARFVSGQHTAMIIPESALQERGQLDAVFIHTDGRVRLRLVRCGKRNSGNVEILSGLATGDKILLNPPKSLRDGDQVGAGLAAS